MLAGVAVLAFSRFRLNWGGLDWQYGTDNPYSDAQTAAGGASAAAGAGNIGIRRATLHFDRASYAPADDDMTCHFDFLNYTSGAPDDTWTTADYTTLETTLTAFWAQLKGQNDPKTKLREIRWHRVGPGVVPPNPAERVYAIPTPVGGSGVVGGSMAQQACSVTFHTAVRRSWGRTYLPFNGVSVNAQGRYDTTMVDYVVGEVQNVITAAAAADFHLVVTSPRLSAALHVEKIHVDDVPDVVRRRRLKHVGYRKYAP